MGEKSSERKQFGIRLKQLRLECGLTQEQFGEMINVSSNAVGQFERGVISPNYCTLLSIIKTLNVDANLLFMRDSQNSKCVEDSLTQEIVQHTSKYDRMVIRNFLISVVNALCDEDKDSENENSNL